MKNTYIIVNAFDINLMGGDNLKRKIFILFIIICLVTLTACTRSKTIKCGIDISKMIKEFYLGSK